MNPPIDASTPIEWLIERFENDITYDCHSIERKFGFSDARKEMQKRGRKVLGPIGVHLFKRFPLENFREIGEGYWEHFTGWGWLLYGIIEDHGIKDGPYKGVVFGEQNMGVWIQFCLQNKE